MNNTILPIIVKENKQTKNRAESANIISIKEELIRTQVLSESSTLTEDQKLKILKETYIIDESKVNDKMFLNEWSLSWAGKLFFASAAAYIAGKVINNMPLKIKGTKEQLTAISNAVVASRAFQDELKKPGASIESVVRQMNLRNITRERFRAIVGRDFPL